jgi:hypothetical protein
MDILRTTLASGVKVVDYVPTYEKLPNDYEHVTQCKTDFPLCPKTTKSRFDANKDFRDRFRSYHVRPFPLDHND